MELLEEKLERISSVEHDWMKIVQQERESGETPKNKELVKAYNALFPAAREAYKKDAGAAETIIEEYVGEPESWFLEEVKRSLEIFFIFSYFRDLQKENDKQAIKIIDFYFDNTILYFDPQFTNSYSQYGFETPEAFFDTARALDGLVEYYVSRHFTKNAINRDLQTETGLSSEMCEYISDKIKANYQLLQTNIMMDCIRANADR